jgi:ClpP class serine protease
MGRYALRVGEHYAIKPSAIERDADGFFILLGDSTPENERRGTVAVVHIRGALRQFEGEGGDSYESIVKRVQSALDDKPSAVLLNISSPGGIVAGLNETVFRLQKMRTAAGVPLIAFANELAASAAFALCCACDRRFGPPSAIVGSIGTISTMVSQAAKDASDGFDFRIITSGSRKADGHPHAPITDAAVAAEERRNAQLAGQFFGIASRALRMPARRIESLQAAIYVGDAARKIGLINAVMSLDDAVRGLDKTETSRPDVVAPNEGNVTDRRAKDQEPLDSVPRPGTTLHKAQSDTPGEVRMPLDLKSLIAKTEAAIQTETDPGQLRILEAKLGAFLARAEMDDDDGDDKKKKDDDDDESKSAKAAKKAEADKRAAKAAGHRARASEYKKKAAEAEEEAAKCESEDEEEEEAGKKSEEAKAAVAADVGSLTAEALARVERLEKAEEARAVDAAIASALTARLITPAKAKKLSKEPLAIVNKLIALEDGPLVRDAGGALQPRGATPGSPGDGVPPDALAQIEQAVASARPGVDKDKMRAAMIDAQKKAALNGAGERY